MTKVRDPKPFALTCLIVVMTGQLAVAQGPVIQTGRRRAAAQQQLQQQQMQQQRSSAQHRRQTPPAQATVPTPEAKKVDQQPQRPQVDPLLVLAERAIDKTSQRYLDADKHTPWQIMHGIVALRRDFELTKGDGTINCVDFISNAPEFRGEYWWQVTEHGGRAHPFSVPYAFEGHANQFLALLSMSNLPLNHRFNVDGQRIVTMADMIRNAKMTVNDREEITWTLWFLTHYIDIDSEWTNSEGEEWSMERLVQMQNKQQVTTAPCGGCHGLFALAYARNAFLKQHGRLRGEYRLADQKINRHIELARSLQNSDGSFAVEFFKGPGHSRDFNERIKASGHMLEWLMMATPQTRLNEPWLRRAVASISTDLIHNASQPAECGPLYHALNSLIMYRDRVKPRTTPSQQPSQLASKPKTSEPTKIDVPSRESARKTTDAAGPALSAPDTQRRQPNRIAVKANTPVTTIAPASPSEAFPTTRRKAAGKAPSRRDLLTRKAARRLAKNAQDSDAPTTSMSSEPPSLLRVPADENARIATEPPERVIR